MLDEPTASLDTKSEQFLEDILINDFKDKACILITHRLTFTKYTQRIAVLSDGKIIEEGSHKELMDIPKGHYKSLFETQEELLGE